MIVSIHNDWNSVYAVNLEVQLKFLIYVKIVHNKVSVKECQEEITVDHNAKWIPIKFSFW